MKQIKIGLFGFGVVGEGIYQVLTQKPQLNTTIEKIVIKDSTKSRNAPKELFSTHADDILQNQNIDVVVELIDDASAALEIVTKAMNNGKSVVSANKKMIAENHLKLIEIQRQNKVSFLYEAAVCGSIPILRNLEEYYDNDLLNYIRGIVNGSTNFILTKMINENQSFSSALKTAQESGFAESDPTLDVEGIDPRYKLSIIILHAFGKLIKQEQIISKGIQQLNTHDFQYAKEKGYTIKLIANCQTNGENLVPTVFPTFIKNSETLALVNNEFNGVLLGSALADEQFLYGKGAGRFPTSSAVLSDISALRYDYQYELRKGIDQDSAINYDFAQKFYIGFDPQKEIDLSNFEQIDETYKSTDHAYVTGSIKLNQLKISGWLQDHEISIVSFG